MNFRLMNDMIVYNKKMHQLTKFDGAKWGVLYPEIPGKGHFITSLDTQVNFCHMKDNIS